MAATGVVPLKFRCRMCSKLAVNAFSLLCCGAAVCEDCQPKLPETCPYCQHSPQVTEPNESLRKSITTWLKAKKAKEEKLLNQQAQAAAISASVPSPAIPTVAETSSLPSTAEKASVAVSIASIDPSDDNTNLAGLSRAGGNLDQPDQKLVGNPGVLDSSTVISKADDSSVDNQTASTDATSVNNAESQDKEGVASGEANDAAETSPNDQTTKSDGMPAVVPLDMNDPNSYAPIMQAMQSGDYNLASQLMGIGAGMNPMNMNMNMNMFNGMNPMANMGLQSNLFGGGFGSVGAFGSMGMGPMGAMGGPMMGASGFNGYSVPFGAPPPFSPMGGGPNFGGIGGSPANNHNASMFPSPSNHFAQQGNGYHQNSNYRGRGRGRGYGYRGRGDYSGYGGHGYQQGFNGQQNIHNNMPGSVPSPMSTEQVQAPLTQANDAVAPLSEASNADKDDSMAQLDDAAAEEPVKENDDAEDESDADSLIIKLDGDEDEEAGWSHHQQFPPQYGGNFRRQSSFQSNPNSSFGDMHASHNGFNHHRNGPYDARPSSTNQYAQVHSNGQFTPSSNGLLPPDKYPLHGQRAPPNGTHPPASITAPQAHSEIVPAPAPIVTNKRSAGVGVAGAPTGPKSMREPTLRHQPPPALELTNHKSRGSYGSAQGVGYEHDRSTSISINDRHDRSYRTTSIRSPSPPPAARTTASSQHQSTSRRPRSRSPRTARDDSYDRDSSDRYRRRKDDRSERYDDPRSVEVSPRSESRRDSRRSKHHDRDHDRDSSRTERESETSHRHRHRHRSRSPAKEERSSYTNGTTREPAETSSRKPTRRSSRREDFDIDISIDPSTPYSDSQPPDSSMPPPSAALTTRSDRSIRHRSSRGGADSGSVPATPVSEVSVHDLEREARNRERLAREEMRRYGRTGVLQSPVEESRKGKDREREKDEYRRSERREKGSERERERERDKDKKEDRHRERDRNRDRKRDRDRDAEKDHDRESRRDLKRHRLEERIGDDDRHDEESRGGDDEAYRREKRRKRFSDADRQEFKIKSGGLSERIESSKSSSRRGGVRYEDEFATEGHESQRRGGRKEKRRR